MRRALLRGLSNISIFRYLEKTGQVDGDGTGMKTSIAFCLSDCPHQQKGHEANHMGHAKVTDSKKDFSGRLLRHYISDTWRDQTVRERLSWYYDVLRDRTLWYFSRNSL